MSRTRRDVEEYYVETPVRSLAPHKFLNLTEVNPEFSQMSQDDSLDDPFNYIMEVYM